MTLDEWLNKRFPELEQIEIRYGDNDTPHIPYYCEDEIVEIPYFVRLLVAAFLNKNGSDCVFVVPQAEVMACLTALISALSNTKHYFQLWREEFAKNGLTPGQRVRLIPSNTIYEYGKYFEGPGYKFIRLNTLNANYADVSLPLGDSLRLFPTSRKVPKGTGRDNETKAQPELSDLDRVVGIQSFGNYSLFKNRIILQTSQGKMDSFLEMWSIHRRQDRGNIEASLKDLRDFPYGSISRDGHLQSFNIYQIYGEPIIAFSSNLSSIDEFCSKQAENTRSIITSNKKAVLENTYESQNLCNKHKFFLLTEDIDPVEAKELKDLGFFIWQPSRQEIFAGIESKRKLKQAKKLGPLRAIYATAGMDRDTIKILDAMSPILEKIERKLIKTGKSVSDSEVNNQTVKALTRIYWRSLELFGTPEKKYHEWMIKQVQAVNEVLKKQASFIGSEDKENLKYIMKSLVNDLWPNIREHSQKKFEAIRNFIEINSGTKILLLCRHPEALKALKQRLDAEYDVVFLTHDDISIAAEIYDFAVMVSWPGKYLFRKLVNSGISHKFVAVLYKNELSAFNSYFKQKMITDKTIRLTREQKAEIVGCPQELFDEDETIQSSNTVLTETEEKEFDEIAIKERSAILDADWSIMPSLPTISAQQSARAVEAFCVTFNNDRCAYLTQTHRLLVIDFHNYQCRNKTLKELAAGDIVVFRESGDREILKEIARKLHPQLYDKYVALASEWKLWLVTLGKDVDDIWHKLSENGLQRNIMTIHNWVNNEELIGPQNLGDIQVIAKATGLKKNINRSSQIANAVKELRGIHIEAGFKLTKLLTKRLSIELNKDIQDIENLETSLADIELMTVQEVDTAPVHVMPVLTNQPHPIWFYDSMS